MEDNAIIDLYFARDERAIAETAQKYGARLRALAERLTADSSDAEECENDTYLDAWRLIPPDEPRTYFFAFLARITRNRALNRLRAEKAARRGEVVPLTEELESVLPAAETDEDEGRITAAISAYLRSQSAEKRNIFLSRYFFGESIAQVAKKYGISEAKVKTTLFRLRAGLRQALEKEEIGL